MAEVSMTELKTNIRKVNPSDLNALQKIGRQTFTETFMANNAAADMQAYIEESFSQDQVSAELRNSGSQFFFAEVDDIVAGYLKLNRGNAQTEDFDPAALEIERIYVLKQYHGKKVGQQLFNTALEIAEADHFDTLWLGVWEKNERAIAFYRKNGFVEFDQHVFMLGNDRQIDILMKRRLR